MAESKRDDRYIQFPLCLLQLTYIEPAEGFKIIYWYGVIKSINIKNVHIYSVKDKLIKAYNQPQVNIPIELKELIIQYFPDNILNENDLLQALQSDEKFRDAATLWYNVTGKWSPEYLKNNNLFISYYRAVKHIESFEQKFRKDAQVSVKINQLTDFISSNTDFDLFRAYLGIKSIIGSKKFAKTNKLVILGRMIGCKSTAAFEHYRTNKYLLLTVEHYIGTPAKFRYQMDKILNKLINRGFIMYLSKPKVRDIYISSYMEPEKLMKLIEKSDAKLNIENRRKAVSARLFSKDYNKLAVEVVSNESIRPTVDEVAEYCKENNYKVNPASFVDYYESRGWFAGKSIIKDWKAAVRLWNNNTNKQKSDYPIKSNYPIIPIISRMPH